MHLCIKTSNIDSKTQIQMQLQIRYLYFMTFYKPLIKKEAIKSFQH